MYYFDLSSASGCFAPDLHRDAIPGSHWGTFVPRSLICLPLEKQSRGRSLFTVVML